MCHRLHFTQACQFSVVRQNIKYVDFNKFLHSDQFVHKLYICVEPYQEYQEDYLLFQIAFSRTAFHHPSFSALFVSVFRVLLLTVLYTFQVVYKRDLNLKISTAFHCQK